MADVFVSLNDVQYCRREWQNRALIENSAHEFYITIPVEYAIQQELIQNIKICNWENFKNKTKATLYHSYNKSLYWNWIKNYIDGLFCDAFQNLIDFDIKSTFLALDMLMIEKPTVHSNHLKIIPKNASDRLYQICKVLNGNIYISGSGGKNYLDLSAFPDIMIGWQNWQEPSVVSDGKSYKNLSFICFLARFGPTALKNHLLSEQVLQIANR